MALSLSMSVSAENEIAANDNGEETTIPCTMQIIRPEWDVQVSPFIIRQEGGTATATLPTITNNMTDPVAIADFEFVGNNGWFVGTSSAVSLGEIKMNANKIQVVPGLDGHYAAVNFTESEGTVSFLSFSNSSFGNIAAGASKSMSDFVSLKVSPTSQDALYAVDPTATAEEINAKSICNLKLVLTWGE